MAFSPSRRKFVLLLLLSLLTFPWVAGADSLRRAHKQDSGVSWNFLGYLWSTFAYLWGEEGCMVDPYGRCAAQAVPDELAAQVDEGCRIDPFGVCKSQPLPEEPTEHVDEGCMIDPFGGCRDER